MTINAKMRGKASAANPEKLTPYERNTRVHNSEQIEVICDSISTFGFIKPVIVDEKHMILAGHGAVQAAIELGMKSIPIRVISGLTKKEKRAYVIADNRSSELSTWDWDLLTMELKDLKSMDMDLKPMGFADFGTEKQTTRKEHNVTIGEGRFLLQLEFETEKEMEKVYGELKKRGLDIKVLE